MKIQKYIYGLADLILLITSFYIIHRLYEGLVSSPLAYQYLILIIITGWLFSSLITHKFKIYKYSNLGYLAIPILLSSLYLLLTVALILVLLNSYAGLQYQILGTAFLFTFLEIFVFCAICLIRQRESQNNFIERDTITKYSFSRILIYIISLLGSFILLSWQKYEQLRCPLDLQRLFFLVTPAWFIANYITQKYKNNNSSGLWTEFVSNLKSTLIILLITSVFILLIQKSNISIKSILLIILYIFVFDTILITIYNTFTKSSSPKSYSKNVHHIADYQKQVRLKNIANDASLYQYLKERLHDLPEIFNTIADLEKIKHVEPADICLLDSEDSIDLFSLAKKNLKYLIDLQEIDKYNKLNTYFLEAYDKLVPGGYYFGKIKTKKMVRKDFYQKYPKPLASIFYASHCLFNKIYSLLIESYTCPVSKAEILGRLSYCGFKILEEIELDNYIYFITKKTKTPSLDSNPTKGILIKLRRKGMQNDPIFMYKFRTMYPYSEYLQDFIYEQYSLNKRGKFFNDFRITPLGKFMRRYWIDELPQILNFLKGDLNLVGVRPLSNHYFDLYPKNLKQLRKKFKCGLIPPYYADIPQNFEQIIASEERYLRLKTKHPIRTDIIYFFKIMGNIVFKGARSM